MIRDKTIQIKVTQDEKELIELYILKLMSIKDNTKYTVSSYISESIMNEVISYEEELDMLKNINREIINKIKE